MRNAAQEHDDLGEDEFGNAAGIGERGIENRDTPVLSSLEIDLVRTNTEAADADEPRRIFDDLPG